MSSAFMLTDALSEALRTPYRKGNTEVTVSYLVHGLKIGLHRVMLKRNFETACWIPPVGKRSSHSIYYGDLMLIRVIDFFIEREEIEIPSDEELNEIAAKQLYDTYKEMAESLGRKPEAYDPGAKVPKSVLFDTKVSWLKDNLPKDKWESLIETLTKSVSAYGRHEREHARNTSQDLREISRELRILGIPFPMFNLFEDARIEHISRQEQDAKFEWMDIEAIAPFDNPFNMFLRCIQLEGESDSEALDSEEPFGKTGERSVGNAAESIQEYYRRAVNCQTDKHLYPIIAEFLDEFKDEMPEPSEQNEGEEGDESGSGGSGSGSSSGSGSGESSEESSGAEERAGDLSTAAEAAEEGDSFFDDFERDAEVVGGTDEEGKAAEADAKEKLKSKGGDESKKGSPGGQGENGSTMPEASGGEASPEDFLAREPGRLDAVYAKRVDDLTTRLMRLFRSHTVNQTMESPGRRMSSRHLARGEIRFQHKKRFGGKGKRKYVLVYDCSGSMHGRPDREGKLFLLAMNNLAKRGYLEGNLILSGWVDGRPGWLNYTFPMDDDVILSINPSHSNEGLQDALADNLKHLRNVDDVFIYTDACICDAPIDRDFFAAKKIWPVGLYVGTESASRHMEEHFPQNIIRNSIEELVDRMLIRNRRTSS